jgi:hypothetical protein
MSGFLALVALLFGRRVARKLDRRPGLTFVKR